MGKEKTLGQRLGDHMVEWARKEGIPVYGPVVIQFPNNEVYEFLERLHRFEEASWKVNIRVGGNGCGYCRRAREMQRAMEQRAY